MTYEACVDVHVDRRGEVSGWPTRWQRTRFRTAAWTPWTLIDTWALTMISAPTKRWSTFSTTWGLRCMAQVVRPLVCSVGCLTLHRHRFEPMLSVVCIIVCAMRRSWMKKQNRGCAFCALYGNETSYPVFQHIFPSCTFSRKLLR